MERIIFIDQLVQYLQLPQLFLVGCFPFKMMKIIRPVGKP